MKRLLLILLFYCFQVSAQPADLSKGTWIKIAVSESGIYKMDKAFFDKYAPEFSKANLDLIKIYTGHHTVLPQKNNIPVLKGLEEVSVWISGDTTRWNKNNFIAFYAKGPHEIRYEDTQIKHSWNPYSNQNFYFITIADIPSKKIDEFEFSGGKDTRNYLPYYSFKEYEEINLLQSGRQWMGGFFNKDYEIKLQTPDFHSDFKSSIELFSIGRIDQFLQLTSANSTLMTDTLKGTTYNSSDNLARYNRIANRHYYQFENEKPVNSLSLKLSTESVGSPGAYIGHWGVQYKRLIHPVRGQQTSFYLPSDWANYNFKLSESSGDMMVWQAISPFEVNSLKISSENTFSVKESESEIILFDAQSIKYPTFEENVKNQDNLLSIIPEMLVIFPERFRKSAELLIDHKREKEGMEIIGYSTDEIYNHYSSGKTDPTAIRNFCKDIFDQSEGKFKYLLLLGDASYDYKGIEKYADPKLMIPTYQSRESLEPIYSYASDDYFGFLKSGLGEWPEGYRFNNSWVSSTDVSHQLDIAIGRIPAKSVAELNNYIEKYINYRESISLSKWQNKVAFIADNRDYNLHQKDSEVLENIALKSYPGLVTDKLYLDDYPMEQTDNGYRSPKAKEKLNKLINSGTYLMIYNGHGAENGLTDEKLLTLEDIIKTQNASTLPIWLTATCAFGRFDNPGLVSAAELSLLKPDGGSIALLTTTRAVFSNTNLKINTAFLENIATAKTLGDLFKITKNQSIQGEINRNFSLLGDPSLPLPQWNTDIELNLDKDTLYPLEEVHFSGMVNNIENGSLLIKIIDKPSQNTTLGSFPDGSAFTYANQSNIIFQGVYTINAHQFNGTFKLPLQQKEGDGAGRIIITAIDSTNKIIDFGYKQPVFLSSVTDLNNNPSPPLLEAHLDETGLLIWEIFDENGINTSRYGGETPIRLFINDEEILDGLDYFIPTEGGNKGRIVFPVNNLGKGTHNTTLTASNIYNIYSSKSFTFEIEKPKLKIINTKVYPNPVEDHLNIRINHNRPGDDLDINFQVFYLSGNKVKEIAEECTKCLDTITLTPNIYSIAEKTSSYIYKLVLKSKSDKQIVETGGHLFFWK